MIRSYVPLREWMWAVRRGLVQVCGNWQWWQCQCWDFWGQSRLSLSSFCVFHKCPQMPLTNEWNICFIKRIYTSTILRYHRFKGEQQNIYQLLKSSHALHFRHKIPYQVNICNYSEIISYSSKGLVNNNEQVLCEMKS